MESVSGFAPGKLILSGEHAVVAGHLAIAVAVDLGTTVTLDVRPGPTAIVAADISDARLNRAVAALLPAEGLAVTIRTTLPVGRGMGSSAALSVALVRAAAALDGREAPFLECYERGFIAERIFHGDPSGVDHTVSALGGGVRYRRNTPITPFTPPPLRLVVMDTGVAGDTAALVAGVAALPDSADRLARIGTLTEQISAALAAGAPSTVLGPLLTDNHRLLRGIGVSTPTLDALVSAALEAGAHGAKLAGAGGGGVVIALVSDEAAAPVAAAARSLGCQAFEVRIPPPSA
jgi:mevalonate kinase